MVTINHRLNVLGFADLSRRDFASSLDEAGLATRVGALPAGKAPEMIALYRKLNPGATPSDISFLIASDDRYGAPTMKDPLQEQRNAMCRAMNLT